MREIVAKNKQQTGVDIDKRLLRQALLMNQIPGNWSDIVNSFDFYSMSNCRDLIFHEQEHQFTPQGIANLLASSQMDFIGMLPTPRALKAFKQQIGDLYDNNTLVNWHTVEQEHEGIFAGMYQFYCRKQSNIKFL